MVDNLCILFSTLLSVYVILRAALAEMALVRKTPPFGAGAGPAGEASATAAPATPSGRHGPGPAAPGRAQQEGWRGRMRQDRDRGGDRTDTSRGGRRA
jgi:hypothetical protein